MVYFAPGAIVTNNPLVNPLAYLITSTLLTFPWSDLRGVWTPKDAVIAWEQIHPSGFHVLQWCWIVERTFAWLSTWRRLAKDYEVLPSSEELSVSGGVIYLQGGLIVFNGSLQA